MKDFLNDIFSYSGRWNRLKFGLYPLAVSAPLVIIGFIFLVSYFQKSLEGFTSRSLEIQKASIESQIQSLTELQLVDDSYIQESDIESLQKELVVIENKITQSPISTSSNIKNIIFLIIILPLLFISFYVQICAYIKRFHDLDKSGWFSLIMFTPFISIIGLIWLGFFKGTKGPNKFGPDPLDQVGVNYDEKVESIVPVDKKKEL